jgi:UDP-N-acetyl-D-galactosamine dehydrogenase
VTTIPDPALPSCIAVIGQGYVGLPLAVAFAQHVRTIGFDINRERIAELRRGVDRNDDVPTGALRQGLLRFSSDPHDLAEAGFFVVSVPTPVHEETKEPDLGPLQAASRTVGQALAQRRAEGPAPVVVFESTVYPGCTEQVCVPILEEASGLHCGEGFVVGYSPERINPGDGVHGLAQVVKVVSGMDASTLERVAATYALVATAGVHRAPDIRTAEAAKVIENVQRDVNIALMNELALLFPRMGVDTHAVLEAARTKWNFLPFTPGLVGGHCIPVDPYYLTYAARRAGHEPELILAGRRVNDAIPAHVASETVRLLEAAGRPIGKALILVLGLTFKEEVRDTRNSGAVALTHALMASGAKVLAHDPHLSAGEIEALGIKPHTSFARGFDAVVVAVAHRSFRESAANWMQTVTPGGVVVDVQGLVDPAAAAARHLAYWRL